MTHDTPDTPSAVQPRSPARGWRAWLPAEPPPHPRRRSWRDEGVGGWFSFLLIVLQLALVVAAAQWLELEKERDFTRPAERWVEWFDPTRGGVLPLLAAAFLVHAFLPWRWMTPFFLAVSFAGYFVVMGWLDGGLLIAFGLALVGICHLPLPHVWRVVLVLAAGVALGLFRSGVLPSPFAATVLPILGSLFMFRLIVYLYDIRNEKRPAGPWRRLAYFFLAPNVCFPLFPVVDYSTFLRTWFDDRDLKIYQKGVHWIARGIVQLVLYRLVYRHFSPAPEDVTDLAGVATFVVSSYLLYMRISGQFHIIVGLLCLFGFNLPETHHRYLLASGFSDYWRRINIYWKDFMMKLVFYPCYVRFKKLGHLTAIVLGTAVVFTVTWFLHAYQWFWLRGAFHFSLVDGLFWAFFALLVIINAVYEAGKPPRAVKPADGFDFRTAARRSLQTGAMFLLICLLFSFWQSNSIGDYFSLLAQARHGGVRQALILAALPLAALGAGVLLPWLGHWWRARRPVAKKEQPAWAPIAATALPLLLIVALTVGDGAAAVFGSKAGEVAHSIRGAGLNERDQRRLERGYYEGLLQRETFGSQLWEVRLHQQPGWQPLERSGLSRKTGDILGNELNPNVTSTIRGVPWRTNEWAMHDHDYTLEKPEGVYRIALLGASYCVGQGIPLEGTFENLVEEALNRHPGKTVERIEILNCAVPGYTLIEFVAFMETRIARFKPDAFYLVTHIKEGPRTLGTLARRIKEDRVPLTYDYLEELKKRAEIPDDPTDADMKRLQPFRDEIVDWGYGRMTDFCRAHRMKPVWLFLPVTDELVVDQKLLAAQRQAARDKGFLTLSLEGAYGAGDASDIWISQDDRHPNSEGHHRIATRMLAELLANANELGLPLSGDAGGLQIRPLEASP